MKYLRSTDVLINLVTMCYNWAASLFSFNLLSFYVKYLPGDLYQNSIMLGLSTLVGGLLYVMLCQRYGTISSFTIVYTISLLGAILILLFGTSVESLMPVFVFCTRAGIFGLYVACMQNTVKIFPTIISASAMGICNFCGNLMAVLSPMIAEYEHPLPI
jgi:nitrate/nitrite transporter NarK